jgi:hypothetical protein
VSIPAEGSRDTQTALQSANHLHVRSPRADRIALPRAGIGGGNASRSH